MWKQLKRDSNGNETEDAIVLPNSASGRIWPTRVPILPRQTTDTTTNVTISVMFYYTVEFAAVTSDIVTYIDHVLDIANQGYINSGLPILVKRQCIEQVGLDQYYCRLTFPVGTLTSPGNHCGRRGCKHDAQHVLHNEGQRGRPEAIGRRGNSLGEKPEHPGGGQRGPGGYYVGYKTDSIYCDE